MEGIWQHIDPLHVEKSVSPTQAMLYYELGRSYYCSMDFVKAERFLTQALQLQIDEKATPFEARHRIYQMLIRIATEQCDSVKQEQFQVSYLEFLEQNNSIQIASKYYYHMGIQFYTDQSIKEAAYAFEKALQIAIEQKDNSDQCYARYGIASCLLKQKDYQKCQAYIDQVKDDLQGNEPDLIVSTYVLQGILYHKEQHFKRAKAAYAVALKQAQIQHNWYLYFSTLYNMTFLQRQQGHLRKAQKLYRDLQKFIASTQLNLLKKLIEKELAFIESHSADLIIKTQSRKLIKRDQTEIPLKNCFILMDLLLLFATQQGAVFDKETLCEKIWQEPYNPLIHDNKIFYNINRLRKLMRTHKDEPAYILTTKDGYSFNRDLRIKILED